MPVEYECKNCIRIYSLAEYTHARLIDEDGSKKDSHHLADAVIQNIGELLNVLSHI